MSASMYWKHAPREPENTETYLDSQFRHAVSQHYFSHDGSLSGEAHLTLDKDYDYLCGLRDAGVEDAEEVIHLLRKHPEGIIIYITH